VDLKYTEARDNCIPWSTYSFPAEQPPEADFDLWKAAIFSLSPAGRPFLRVRGFEVTGHKIWDWRFDDENNRLLFKDALDGLVDLYTPETLPGALGRAD